MKYPTEEYRGRYARALKAATNLATAAMYRTEDAPAFLPPQLQEGVNVPAENLCFLPSGGGYPYDLSKAVRETRTTLVVVEPGETMAGKPTFYFTVILSRGGKFEWHPAKRLWVSVDRKLFLVPDPEIDESERLTFVLDRGVREAPLPWPTTVERDFGLAHGDALLLAP